jgi:hypothetical protein
VTTLGEGQRVARSVKGLTHCVACLALVLFVAACGSDPDTPATASTSTAPPPTTGDTASVRLDASQLILSKSEVADELGISEGELGLGIGGPLTSSSSMRTWCSDVQTPVDSGAAAPNLGGLGQAAYVFATETEATEVMQRATATPAPCEWDLGPFAVSFPTAPKSVEGLGDEALVIDVGALDPTVELQVRSGRVIVVVQVNSRLMDDDAGLQTTAEKLARRALTGI